MAIRQRWWDRPGAPRVVLVHGGAAHAGWWTHLAPELASEVEVVALDLSGHGDSGHRDRYRFATWAEEVLACGGDVVVGHSMGGIVATLAAARAPESIRHLVLVDTPLRRPDDDHTGHADSTLARARTHPTREAAIARFRPLPPQPVTDRVVFDQVAAESVRRGPDGWGWKFDPRAFTGDGPEDRPTDITPLLARLACAVSSIVGERSVIVTDRERAVLRELGDYVEIPGGHHHLMLDAQQALVDAVREALSNGGATVDPPGWRSVR